MGILNVTPDSFSDGGSYASSDDAIEAGMAMVENGADIIDVGGESTRPGSDAVSPEEELRRVIPVIQGLAVRTDKLISIDTMKAAVAREATAQGAEMINDVSAMSADPAMISVAIASGAAVALMHMRGTPKTMQTGDLSYRSCPGDIVDYLRTQMEWAIAEGLDPERILIDPGIGFGKQPTDNLKIINHINDFNSLGRPILIGPSRKSFIGQVTGGLPGQRDEGTAAAVTVAILRGAHIVRVHNVKMMKKVVEMADAIART
jgi:dihydropteroate synthase